MEKILNLLEGSKKEKAKRKKGWGGQKGQREREGEGLGCKLIGGQDGTKKIGLGDERASKPTVLEG